jgi:hypothetical protein
MKEYIEREALDDFKNEVVGRFIALCFGNDYNKLSLLTIGNNIDEIYEKYQTRPAADVEVVRHGEWVLTANEEKCNDRWNVTAECSECRFSKGEVYAGFFPSFPKNVAQSIVLDRVKAVKLDNYCPHCGARMDGKGEDE